MRNTSPSVRFGQITAETGHRVVIYGPGGIGKTSLAAVAPGPVAFFDLDDSLPRLNSQLPNGIDTRLVAGESNGEPMWEGLRASLHADGWDGIKTIVID